MVAADLTVVHRGTLVCKDTARDRDYDAYGVGIRSLELMFRWAKANGLEAVDIGGGFAYKQRWAPEDGTRSTLVLRPRRSLPVKFLDRGRRIAGALGRRSDHANAAAAESMSPSGGGA
jgi:CelD/BcsL family acetyltransferase involved in cellulose biosynthesis